MKKTKQILCLLLAAVVLLQLSACGASKVQVTEVFDSLQKISYCTTYKTLSEKK